MKRKREVKITSFEGYAHSIKVLGDIKGKMVLDFGCGDGPLSLFLAKEKRPRRIVGVDISNAGIERAKSALTRTLLTNGVDVEFLLGSTDQLPVPDQSF